MKRIYQVLFLLVLAALLLSGCKTKKIVNFDTLGGSSVESVSFSEFNDSISTFKTGYNFIGWTKDLSSNTIFKQTDLKKEKNSITLFAVYELINYTINYENTNNLTNPNPMYYNIETPTIYLTNLPSYEEEAFLGWFDSENNEVNSIEKGTTGNIVLKAQWIEKSILEEKVDLDMDLVEYNSYYYENTILNLPSIAPNGSVITYSYFNMYNPDNGLVDLENQILTVSNSGVKTIRVKVQFALGSIKKTKIIDFIIGAQILSIKEAVIQIGDSFFSGVISGVTKEYLVYTAFIEDDQAAAMIAFTEEQALNVGDEVIVYGAISLFDLNYYVGAVKLVEVIDENQDYQINNLLIDEIKNIHLNRVISFTGQLKSVEEDIVLVTEQGEMFITDLTGQSLNLSVNELLSTITVQAHVLPCVYSSSGYRLWLLDANNLFNDGVDEDLVEDIFLTKTNLAKQITTQEDIALPTKLDYYDVDIIWESSHPGVVFPDGTVILSEEDVNVTLTYKLVKQNRVIIENYINVTVLRESGLMSYYEGLENLAAEALVAGLKSRLKSGFVGVNYGDARYILQETDLDPDNASNVILVYSGFSVSKTWDYDQTWNREHVWPQSRLNSKASNSAVNSASDLHNLKPADPGYNTSRSNHPFTENLLIMGSPVRDEVRGDVARMILYMAIMYEDEGLALVTNNPTGLQMGMLDVLLRWHYQDLPDDFEKNRNEIIYSYQKNRNPFIDYPEFVGLIWDLSLYGIDLEALNLKPAILIIIYDFPKKFSYNFLNI